MSFLLKANTVMTLTANINFGGSYWEIGNPGDSPIGYNSVSANSTATVGPFNVDKNYEVCNLSITTALADYTGLATDDSNTVHKTDSDVHTYSWVLNETTLTSDSATKVPTQHSVKSYADTALALKAPLASPAFTGNPTIAKVNGTEASNAVTANGAAGVITTSALTTIAGGTYVITWTNTAIASTSVILLQNMGGTNTIYSNLSVVAGSGSATLTIDNIDLVNPLNGTIKIGYLVI